MVCCRHLYRDGGWTEVAAGSEPEPIEFPPPLGKIRIFHCGHLEPLTIPRYIKVKNVSIKGALIPDWNNKLADLFARLKLISTPNKNDRMARIIHTIEGVFRVAGIAASGAQVEVTGLKGGKRRTISYSMTGRMGRLTRIPASIGALMLVRGRASRGESSPLRVVSTQKPSSPSWNGEV